MDGPNQSSPLAGDFLAVLKQRKLISDIPPNAGHRSELKETTATTILGFKFAGGVLVAGDRRATSGNVVMYDRADKVLEIDRHSVMAIAGSDGGLARGQAYRRQQVAARSAPGLALYPGIVRSRLRTAARPAKPAPTNKDSTAPCSAACASNSAASAAAT